MCRLAKPGLVQCCGAKQVVPHRIERISAFKYLNVAFVNLCNAAHVVNIWESQEVILVAILNL